jgi:hypothetical protein
LLLFVRTSGVLHKAVVARGGFCCSCFWWYFERLVLLPGEGKRGRMQEYGYVRTYQTINLVKPTNYHSLIAIKLNFED